MAIGGREKQYLLLLQRTRFTSVVLVLTALLLLSACVKRSAEIEAAIVTPLPTSTAETQDMFAGVDGVACIPNLDRYEIATLIDVVDGDSIKVIVDGQPTQVRYIGVNTPEYDSQQRTEAIAATNANRGLLSGSTLYLFKDISNTDKYDRLLRYVVANGKFINLELVRLGHAESKWYRPDISCQELFDQAMP